MLSESFSGSLCSQREQYPLVVNAGMARNRDKDNENGNLSFIFGV
jgi:hypothetical protein